MKLGSLEAQPGWTSWHWVVDGADELHVAVVGQKTVNVRVEVLADGVDVSGKDVGETAL